MTTLTKGTVARNGVTTLCPSCQRREHHRHRHDYIAKDGTVKMCRCRECIARLGPNVKPRQRGL